LPVAAGLLLVALACIVFGASRTPGPTMLALCVVAALLATAGTLLLVWALAYRRLEYALTESALRIQWLGRTTVVPYPAIQGIYGGQRLSGQSTPTVPRWPGINVGPARVRGLGRLRFFATSTDQSQLTFITVEHGGVIISAQDPTEFQSALIAHVEQYGEEHEPTTWHQRPPSTLPWTALADPWFPTCAAVGLLALLATLAIVTQRYDALPDQLPLHFDASGQTSQIAPKSDLLRLPLLGLLCLAVNWGLGVVVHARERILGRLLWLGGIVVQLVLLIAVIRLVA
jgi:PH (Pleckstrin Homology) domain-containing protein/uncharacterized protein DUF1648